MPSVNKAIIIGHLGQDPEIKYTGSGTPVANFSIATSRRYKNQEETKEETEWHKIVVWGKQAENCKEYLSKGHKAYIEGRIQTRKYNDREGVTRYMTEIVADRVLFLESRKTERTQNNNDQDEMPF